jgi:FkbM family methyltransferase
VTLVLEKFPIVRGWVARWDYKKKRERQLQSYTHFLQSLTETSIKQINFDSRGCIYLLEDGRSFLFDPEKSAGWLYSIPSTGTFEEKETEFLRKTIKPGWTCLDVGACFGWYSILFSKLVGTAGKVHSFEPVPDNRECLERNIELNNLENIQVNSFALGAEPGISKIYVPNDGVSGSLRAHTKTKDCRVIDIDISTLDQYVHKNALESIDFIKADIEGAEMLMLQGAEVALRKYRPMLMLEVQAHSTKHFGYEPKELFSWLQKLGYKSHFVDKKFKLISCDHLLNDKQLPDYNFIFLCRD